MNKYELATNIELAKLDGYEGKMTAEQQRSIFGAALFGRKTIKIDASNQGIVWCSYSSGYQNTGHAGITFDRICNAINTGTKINF